MSPAGKTLSRLFLSLLALSSAAHGEATAQERAQGASARQPAAGTYEALLDKAAALLRSGKAKEAYRLLAPLEFDHAGEPRFDYLLGVAALDSGRPDTATFVLERALAVNPDFTAARLDLARAYYQLGDLARARSEFAAVLKQDPPPAARDNIENYLHAIDAHRPDRRTRARGYLEAALGQDNNINFSTSEHQVFIDRFATLATLDSDNVQMADRYYALGAGAAVEHDLGTRWSLDAGASVRKRDNATHARFDLLNLDLHAGASYVTGSNRIRIGLFGGRYDVGGAHHSDVIGIKGEWHRTLSPANEVQTFVQHLEYRFTDILLQPNDFDQQAIGLGWRHVRPSGKSILSVSVHYGREDDVSSLITEASPDGGRADGGKRFHGVRLGAQTTLGARTRLFASAGVQAGEYDKVNYYFQRTRSDQLYDVTLGAAWQWRRQWTLRPQISYSGNDSNIAIYDYDRRDVSLAVRHDFR